MVTVTVVVCTIVVVAMIGTDIVVVAVVAPTVTVVGVPQFESPCGELFAGGDVVEPMGDPVVVAAGEKTSVNDGDETVWVPKVFTFSKMLWMAASP